MRSLLVLGFAVLSAVSARAQERHVTVQLLDGESVEGAVVPMNAAAIRVQVRAQARTIDATRMRTCGFDEPQEPVAGATAPAAPAVPAPLPGKAPQEPKPKSGAKRAAPVVPGVDANGVAALPVDVRHRSLLRSRLIGLDETYPWLQPTAPMQWLSLGLLLSIVLSLTVHSSVRVAGSEAATLSRSACLGLWYMLAAFVQLAGVPTSNLSVVLMLLANPAVALFMLTSLFGLTRGGAFIAFAVQLGFAALAFGVLELVTAILGSIAPPTS